MDADILFAGITADGAADRLAAIYAPHISSEYAAKLLADLMTPTGRLAGRLEYLSVESGPQAVKAEFAKLSPKDMRALNEFHASLPYRALLNAQNKSSAEGRKMFASWGEEIMKARINVVRDEMVAFAEAQLKSEKSEVPVDVLASTPAHLTRTGLRPLDQSFEVIYGTMRRYASLYGNFVREVRKVDLKSVLSPERLVTREGIESGTLAVMTAEKLINDFYAQAETLSTDADQSLSRISMPPEYRQQLNASFTRQLGATMELRMRAAEHERTIMEIAKRILAFCEERQGKITLRNGAPLFQDAADVETYNGLLQQLRKEAAQEQGIVRESDSIRRESVDKMKSM
jgi:hypothetical protein